MNDLDLCLEVISRSCQPLRYIRRWISRNPLEIEAWSKGPPIWNGIWANKWSRERWRHVTLKGQTCDHNTLTAQYHENGWRLRLRCKGLPIGNGIWAIKWSCDRWRHVTPKVLWGSTVGYLSDSLASCILCGRHCWGSFSVEAQYVL